jgi:tetratricopeptide (TPR) repeat protein
MYSGDSEMTDKIEELLEKAVNLRTQEKFEEAVEILEALYMNNPNSENVKKCLLETLFSYGGYLNDDFILKYETAKEMFSRIIEIDPNNYRAYYNLGIANFNLSNIKEAKECYEKAIRIKPEYKHCLYNIGLVYENEGDLQEALKYYEKALEIDPKFPYASNARNQILSNLEELKRRKLDKSQEKLDTLISLFEVSKRIRIDIIQSLLEINKDKLYKFLIELGKNYQCEIDGDFLIINKHKLPEIINILEEWDI